MNAYLLLKKLEQALVSIYPIQEASSIALLCIEHLYGMNRSEILAQKMISQYEESKINHLITRLKRHEPVQYVLGKADFYQHTFKVNPHVLIPRPETEELVHWIIQNHQNQKELSIWDIATGSGCIAISLALHLQNPKVFATDINAKALEVAMQNAQSLEAFVYFYQNDILDTTTLPMLAPLDIIVSNPPYVTISERGQMLPNVLNFEPAIALFVPDENPLLFYHRIAELGTKYLKSNGSLYFEMNERFGTEICQLLSQKGYQNIALKQDIHQKNRFVSAQYYKAT
jgi:release factor glutamine methyltransferase